VVLIEEPPEAMNDSGFSPGGNLYAALMSGAILNHLGEGYMTFCDGHIEE
jgi:hypothetical protein